MSLKSESEKIFKHIKTIFSLESLSNPENPCISANIICHNNISSIEACLKSLRDVVDEIVVVDGGSTDGTIEVLEKYDAKIMVNKHWQGYSYQRNLAIQHSRGDWILKLDSDEFLSMDLRKNLHNLCKSKIFSGYKTFSRWVQKIPPNLIDKLSLISEKELDDLPRYIVKSPHRGRYKAVLRLVRKTPALEFRGDIHEAIFGLENLRIKKLSYKNNNVYHLDTAMNSFESRLEKVQQREEILRGSGHGEEYLPELYENLVSEPMPFEDLPFLKYLKFCTIQY